MAEIVNKRKMPDDYEVELALAIVSSMNNSGMQVKDIHRLFLNCYNEICCDKETLRKSGIWH